MERDGSIHGAGNGEHPMNTIKGRISQQSLLNKQTTIKPDVAKAPVKTEEGKEVKPTKVEAQQIKDELKAKQEEGGKFKAEAVAKNDARVGQTPQYTDRITFLSQKIMSDQGKVDMLAANTWEPGVMEAKIQEVLARAQDPTLSGTNQASYTPEQMEVYKATLGGKPVSKYDPNSYLASLGVHNPMSSGRTSKEFLRGLKVVSGEYSPDSTYFPVPESIKKQAHGLLLGLNKLGTPIAAGVEKLVDATIVKKQEAPDMKGPAESLHGNPAHIDKGHKSGLANEQRYLGLSVQQVQQHAWGENVHLGSVAPNAKPGETGTYDIARSLGFTEEQARRIGQANVDVDENNTHYIDPKTSKPRISKSGSGGLNGDYHWHFNRSEDGQEDTRITGAKIHMDRAVDFAKQGFHEAAEKELGYGLHKLQDVFAHSQMMPVTHATVDGFPDMVNYHPVAKYESDAATQGYLKEFAKRLELVKPSMDQAAAAQTKEASALVAGDASQQAKQQVAHHLAKLPAGLRDHLAQNDVQIHVVKPGSDLSKLGFGVDVTGDGKVVPGDRKDVNSDGILQAYEVEGNAPDGLPWSEKLGGYSHDSRNIFVSEKALTEGKLDEVLRHEIRHAVDMTLREDPEQGAQWNKYVDKVYEDLRRAGAFAFDADKDEVIAHLE